ncbi:MAG: YfjI family protein [Paracoccaceae bacterium]|nr:YfjI family protein [Paracoccaceae bacterium]
MAKDFNASPDTTPPEPLIRARPEGHPFPLEHLGPLCAPTEALATLTQAPEEIGFQSLLAVASLATQPIADVEAIAGKTPLSLFFLTVAASGERKSSCDKLAMASVQAWEEASLNDYLQCRKSFDLEQEIFESMNRKHVKARSDGEDVVESDAPQAPQAPLMPRKILSDVTFEGLLHHFEEGDPSVGIFSDEGGQLFGGHAMSKDNQLKTVAGLSKLWDAASLNRTRAGQSLATFRHRRGCLHLMLQSGVAESVFSNEVLRDQGFLSRCLIAWPASRIGSRIISETDADARRQAAAQVTLARHHSKITSLLSLSPETTADPRELAPSTVRLSPEARSCLIRFANEVERLQGDGGDFVHIRGFASKAAEQAARIAGVFTLLEDQTARTVTQPVLLDAIGLTSWYLSEAQRTLDAGHVDPTLQMAELLGGWLRERFPLEPFDKRTIVRRGPGAVRDTKTVEILLKLLDQHHWITPCPGAQIDGRTVAKAWRVRTSV